MLATQNVHNWLKGRLADKGYGLNIQGLAQSVCRIPCEGVVSAGHDGRRAIFIQSPSYREGVNTKGIIAFLRCHKIS